MSTSFDPAPIRELRGRIEREIAELRLHYGALMPSVVDRPPEVKPWQPTAGIRPVAATAPEPATLAHRALRRPKAAVAERST